MTNMQDLIGLQLVSVRTSWFYSLQTCKHTILLSTDDSANGDSNELFETKANYVASLWLAILMTRRDHLRSQSL